MVVPIGEQVFVEQADRGHQAAGHQQGGAGEPDAVRGFAFPGAVVRRVGAHADGEGGGVDPAAPEIRPVVVAGVADHRGEQAGLRPGLGAGEQAGERVGRGLGIAV